MRKFIVDLDKGILEKLNISLDQLKQFEYSPSKQELKRLQNKRYYEAHKEKLRKINKENAQKRRKNIKNTETT